MVGTWRNKDNKTRVYRMYYGAFQKSVDGGLSGMTHSPLSGIHYFVWWMFNILKGREGGWDTGKEEKRKKGESKWKKYEDKGS